MTAPTVGNWNFGNSWTATTITVTKPTGLANGHVLFYAAYMHSTSDFSSWPSGFTSLFTLSDGNYRLAARYKIITNAAGEPASYTVNMPSNTYGDGFLGIVSGADTTTPPTGTPTTNTGASTSVISPSMTTAHNDALVLSIHSNYFYDPMSTPSGTTLWGSTFSTPYEAIRVCWFNQASAGATATKTSTISSSYAWIAAQVAFKPPATTTARPAAAIINRNPFLQIYPARN